MPTMTDSEYTVTVPRQYNADWELPTVITIDAVGGGTPGRAYAWQTWRWSVIVDFGTHERVMLAGTDLHSNATPATHAAMARTLANFLSAAGESLYRRGDASDWADEYPATTPAGRRNRAFLEAEYERLAMFAMDPTPYISDN